jgi:hypothetical protein
MQSNTRQQGAAGLWAHHLYPLGRGLVNLLEERNLRVKAKQ